MSKILLFLEPLKDGLKRTSYEVITAGRNLLEMSKSTSNPFDSMVGIVINGSEEQANTVKEYGLSDIILVNIPNLNSYSSTAYAEIIKNIAKEQNASVILFSGNASGLELAPRVAAKFEAGYISDCVGLNILNNEIIAKKPVYAGKAQVSAKIDSNVKVFSLRPNVFTSVKSEISDLNIQKIDMQIDEKFSKVIVKDVIKNEGKLDVLEADIIVSGGRAVKGPENYYLIENLAAAFGGAVGASRAVVDAGWRPHSEQVGQTGKTVSPTLYVAAGISGAVQHLAGMSSSKFILAINKDKDAPIFKVADYGIIGDIFEVLPKLTEKVKLFTGK